MRDMEIVQIHIHACCFYIHTRAPSDMTEVNDYHPVLMASLLCNNPRRSVLSAHVTSRTRCHSRFSLRWEEYW